MYKVKNRKGSSNIEMPDFEYEGELVHHCKLDKHLGLNKRTRYVTTTFIPHSKKNYKIISYYNGKRSYAKIIDKTKPMFFESESIVTCIAMEVALGDRE